MKAIITGSFDPITLGHIEVIKKASSFFDELYVVALLNEKKEYVFSLDEKKEIMELSLQDYPNIIVDAYSGLTADYMHNHGIKKIVRGTRSDADREYEEKLADAMKSYDKDFETILIKSDDEYSHISSTFVRECLKKGESLDGIVHKNAKNRILEIYNSKK
ncbi:MAG: pantetheine-phosphate adenylyltransferase [Ruminococcaceae bacterium]|nr:pantetheine-phosphate adenylyltransferase [Oscillospiraceae bacterium]